jgi:peptide/nickel transport system substrate-binding protein
MIRRVGGVATVVLVWGMLWSYGVVAQPATTDARVGASPAKPGAPRATARTLRFSSAFDPQTMDPHALALLYHTRLITQIYDSLVNRDRAFKLEPALATSWAMTDPTTWRFKLRGGVVFHDGAPFTAEDAVFSIQRALEKTSQRANQMRGITGARKIDDTTIEITTSAPDAVLPDKLWLVAMMNKAWAEKHGVSKPQDYNGKQETHAVRNANGTGPFVLVRYESDVRTILKANPTWWGKGTSAGGGNLDEVTYTVIQSDATRLAALASNQVDFVADPPFQDLPRLARDDSLTLVRTTDIGTQYLVFDQHRDELQGSDVKGRNPFKDVRVRRAVQLAVDVDLIAKQVLRGQGTPTGSFVSPLVDGHEPAYDKRPAADPARAKALLVQAGYPQGFSVTMDCVNVAFRAAVCQAAAAMLEKVGIRAAFNPLPSSTFFPKLTQGTGSLLEFGWSPGTDAWTVLHSIVRTHDGQSGGAFNGGRYSNAKLDALIDGIRVQPDLTRRRALVGDALKLMNEDLPLVPLYRRHHNWVMKRGIKVVQWPNDVLELRWVTMP